MGGAAGITLLFGMIRTKFVALLIGSSGVGLLTNLTAIQLLVSTITNLGIPSSAVQSLAAATTSSNRETISRVKSTVIRLSWITGLLGAIGMTVFNHLLSLWMFSNDNHATEILWLGIAILAMNISGGQLALLQGLRKIGNMAFANVLTAFFGTLLSIGLYIWLGIRGVVPAMLALALIQLINTSFFANRISTEKEVIQIPWLESMKEATPMLRLGLTVMWSSAMTSLVAYISNALITQHINLAAVGINSAAFALSGMFVNFVLNAMGSDYYPNLSRAKSDKQAMNQLVNEQTEIGILLTIPGVLATLSFAPWIIRAFYSSEFLPAASLLEWYVLGCLIRVIQWPMGFLQLVSSNARWFLVTQTTLNGLHLAFIWIGIHWFGLKGVSIAFFALYCVSLWIILLVARHLTGFTWNSGNLKIFLRLIPLIAVNFLLDKIFNPITATVLGACLTITASVYCLRELVTRIGSEHRIVLMACRIPGMKKLCGIQATQKP